MSKEKQNVSFWWLYDDKTITGQSGILYSKDFYKKVRKLQNSEMVKFVVRKQDNVIVDIVKD